MSTTRTWLGTTLALVAATLTAAASLGLPASAASSGDGPAAGPREAIVTRDSAGNTKVMAPDAKGGWKTVDSASSVGLRLDEQIGNAPAALAAACYDYFHAYIIYIPFGPELMRWNFKETFCLDGVNVTSMASDNDIRVFSSAIVKGGSNTKNIGPVPATVVRVVYPNQTFGYCPLTPPSNCVANFSPVIDHYFLSSGQILNLSTL